MALAPPAFDAQYPPELFDQAARSFRDYLFRRYGPLLVAACVVNAIGLAVVLWFGVKSVVVLAGLVFIVVLGPAWLLYEYFLAPSRYAARLKHALPLSNRVTITSESLALTVRDREAAIPWTTIKAIVETQALFLLVLSPFAFAFVPRSGLPVEAYDTLHSRAQASAA
jgi:hypothetical protein